MWSILGFLAKLGGLLLDRFWPSKDRELGRAEAERKGLKANVEQIAKAVAARRAADRVNANPERLRESDGHRRD